MKIFSASLGALLAGWLGVSAHAVTVAEEGIPRAEIVVARDASPAERRAARELGFFLGQVTGGRYPVGFRPEGDGSVLYVGVGAASLADPGFSPHGLGTSLHVRRPG